MNKDEIDEDAAEAAKLYLEGRNHVVEGKIWRRCINDARVSVEAALQASQNLTRIEDALCSSGSHVKVFRHLLAPPCSQDQFALLTPGWSKSAEKSGRPLPADNAIATASTLKRWLDKEAVTWWAEHRTPTEAELDRLIERTAILIANQAFQTTRRNALDPAPKK